MPSGWSIRHFVFFHEKAHFLIGLCHMQPNNKAISEVFLYDERPSESDKAVFSHQLSWTFFWRELWLTQWRNSQYRGQNNHQLIFCWWHLWLGVKRGEASLSGGSPGKKTKLITNKKWRKRWHQSQRQKTGQNGQFQVCGHSHHRSGF